MSIYTLSKTFQRLKILSRNIPLAKYHTAQRVEASNVLPLLSKSQIYHESNSFNETLITFTVRSINIDMNLPTNIGSIKNIIDSPLSIKWEIEDPLRNIHNKEDKMPEISVDLPSNGIVIERQAAKPGIRVIRQKKMKKHKRKKFRKRMKYTFLKINKRRGVKREKLFQAELWAKVKDAEKFDAKVYVESRIELLTRKRLPPTYYGEVLPEEMIKKFLKEKEARKEAKRNRPRLKL